MKTRTLLLPAALLATLFVSGSALVSGSAAALERSSPIKAAIIVSDNTPYNNLDACIFMAGALFNEHIAPAIVNYQAVDTMSELLEYDVFIFGSCGHYYGDRDSGYGIIEDEVRSFVEDHGRGVVGVGGVNYTCAANRYHDYDAILPIHAHVPYGYLWGYDIDITEPAHPITTQVGNFGFDVTGLAEWCPGGTKTGSLVLAEYVQNNRESVVYWSTGPAQGRVAYVGPFFLADADNFATLELFQDPDAVRLLVNAVRWVSSKTTLSIDRLVPTQTSTITVVNAQPGHTVITAYSVHGGGPVNSPWGEILLTPPFVTLPHRIADQHGMVIDTRTCPNLPGLQLWLQSLDLEEGRLSNGWDGVIE